MRLCVCALKNSCSYFCSHTAAAAAAAAQASLQPKPRRSKEGTYLLSLCKGCGAHRPKCNNNNLLRGSPAPASRFGPTWPTGERQLSGPTIAAGPLVDPPPLLLMTTFPMSTTTMIARDSAQFGGRV